jgi:DNA (cytosine-5)-methyltransferase 1
MGHANSHANAGGQLAVAHALRAEGFDASEDGTGRGTPITPVRHPIAIQERAVSENPNAGPDGAGFRSDGAAYTLESRTVSQAVAFAQNQRDEVRTMEVSGALAAEPGMKQQTYLALPDVGLGHNGGPPLWEVRRLTPRECERLQGFPDDFTRIPWGARKRLEAQELLYIRLTNPELTMDEARRLAADGPRYKALGNSWAVNCAEWIGERIAALEAMEIAA